MGKVASMQALPTTIFQENKGPWHFLIILLRQRMYWTYQKMCTDSVIVHLPKEKCNIVKSFFFINFLALVLFALESRKTDKIFKPK